MPLSRPRSSRWSAKHAVLRPSPRARADRLGRRRAPAHANGRTLIGKWTPRRQGRAPALRPAEICGGQDGINLAIAAIREHLAAKGLGLHNDLQDESSIVGNFPIVQALARLRHAPSRRPSTRGHHHRREASRVRPDRARPRQRRDLAGDDRRAATATIGSSTAASAGTAGLHVAHADLVFARTSGKQGDARGITAFIVPTDTPGHRVHYNHWTFNMPSDHAEVGSMTCASPTARSCARGRGPGGRAALRAREPHSPGRRRARAPPVTASRSRKLREWYCRLLDQSLAARPTRMRRGRLHVLEDLRPQRSVRASMDCI